MIFVTGDTHRDFTRIATFCQERKTTKSDLMIVQGDAGVNYCEGWQDEAFKGYLDKQPITFLFLHGNHEIRPETIPTYARQYSDKVQGYVWQENRHPDLLFAIDGETYVLAGKTCLVCGGAYSVDKQYRLASGKKWWPDEQPGEEARERFAIAVDRHGGSVDLVMTHTCPYNARPVEDFLPMIDQSTVDTSTEQWLEGMRTRLQYGQWFCGHYHVDKVVDNIRFLYREIVELA